MSSCRATNEKAHEVAHELRAGLEAMRADREGFKELNPANGWGTYEGALRFLEACATAFTEYPNATIEVSR